MEYIPPVDQQIGTTVMKTFAQSGTAAIVDIEDEAGPFSFSWATSARTQQTGSVCCPRTDDEIEAELNEMCRQQRRRQQNTAM